MKRRGLHTERDNQILALLAAGRSSKEIAATLGLAGSTVKVYRGMIADAFHVRTIHAAVAEWQRRRTLRSTAQAIEDMAAGQDASPILRAVLVDIAHGLREKADNPPVVQQHPPIDEKPVPFPVSIGRLDDALKAAGYVLGKKVEITK